MANIRTLAQHDRTVLTVIHQPSSEVYELFDKLCLLSGGCCTPGRGMCVRIHYDCNTHDALPAHVKEVPILPEGVHN